MNYQDINAHLHVERGAFNRLNDFINYDNYSSVFLLTEEKIFEIYGSHIQSQFQKELQEGRFFKIPGGEMSKSLEWVDRIGEQMLISGLERHSLLVAMGGGVITDLGGLTASLFMRGIDFINVPTTLVGQVDAAIGGKCGVNLAIAKNIMGLFSLPKLILIDPHFLDTLTDGQIHEGMVEVLKIAAVADTDFFKHLEATNCNISQLGNDEKASLIERAARLKLDVVAKDFREDGYRKILNFGHTTGHALEALQSYSRFSHGQAVAIGILVAAETSELACGFNRNVKDRLKMLTRKLIKQCSLANIEVDEVWHLAQFDKKKDSGRMNFTLLKALGRPIVLPVDKEQFSISFSRIIQELSG
ncbi:MAG: 3-dehydroquinate synthase [candidate division Zixibacteria bacterium CG_4_9_14_3_um_filter_46_8]|nr:MAG: 3-dehydroquinate synthase [candidate division Zixibacteria bacterium CG_4_9_14_3_um_filter_46_8]